MSVMKSSYSRRRRLAVRARDNTIFIRLAVAFSGIFVLEARINVILRRVKFPHSIEFNGKRVQGPLHVLHVGSHLFQAVSQALKLTT